MHLRSRLRARFLSASSVLFLLGAVACAPTSIRAGATAGTAGSAEAGHGDAANARFPSFACAEEGTKVTERADLEPPMFTKTGPCPPFQMYQVEGCGKKAFFNCLHSCRSNGVSTRISSGQSCSPADDQVCAQATIAECQSFCDQGVKGACGSLGALYMAGQRVPADLAKAKELLTIGCDGGSTVSCMLLQNDPRLVGGADRATLLTRNCQRATGEPGDIAGEDACREIVRQRAQLPVPVVGLALQKLCKSGRGSCGEWKDFAAANHLPLDP